MPTMLILPWRGTGRARAGHTVVFASRFDAASALMGWKLFWYGIKVRRAVLRSDGALGVSLRAHPLKGRYYTMSMWSDEVSLKAFAGSDAHREAVGSVTRLGPVSGVLLSRDDGAGRPQWKETMRWIDAAEHGPYRIDKSIPQEI